MTSTYIKCPVCHKEHSPVYAQHRCEVVLRLQARVEELEGILDSISDMEGREDMTDAEFVRQALLKIEDSSDDTIHSS